MPKISNPAISRFAELGDRSDLLFWTNKNWGDEPSFRCANRSFQRGMVPGINDGGPNRFEFCTVFEQFVIAIMPHDLDFGQGHSSPVDPFSRSDHLCGSGNNFFSPLIHAAAVKYDDVLFGPFLGSGDGHCDSIAQADRFEEAQILRNIDRARAGEPRSQNSGDQRTAPHPMSDDAVKHACLGIGLIQMCRIDITGHDGKQRNVVLRQCAHQTCGFTDDDLIERSVFDNVAHDCLHIS